MKKKQKQIFKKKNKITEMGKKQKQKPENRELNKK